MKKYTRFSANKKIYKKGDFVWYAYGKNLLVECKITEVDLQYCKKGTTGGVIFYDLDVPIGHSVDENDIFPTFKEAVEAIGDWVKEDKYCFSKLKRSLKKTMIVRARHLTAQYFTYWLNTPMEDEQVSEKQIEGFLYNVLEYPKDREYKKDWFYWQDIL